MALRDEEHRRRVQRQRQRAWHEFRRDMRRDAAGQLVPRAQVVRIPSYIGQDGALGPLAIREVRAAPASGRVVQAGIDTWSPAWYAGDSMLARVMASRAEGQGRVRLLREPVSGYRVGWFPETCLVFAEGHPVVDGLGCPDDLPAALDALEEQLQASDVPVGPTCRAGVRRLDAAVDLRTDSASEGLGILAGVAALTVPGGKLVAYRSGRAIESVLLKSASGKTTARVYDKGVESGRAQRGRLIRPEDQRRYVKATRRDAHKLTVGSVRQRYRDRFVPLYHSAKGVKVAGALVLAERLGEAVDAGMIEPSRARSLAGYLVLEAAGVPQGSRSTRYTLERECRELRLILGAGALQEVEVDLGASLEADAWARRG